MSLLDHRRLLKHNHTYSKLISKLKNSLDGKWQVFDRHDGRISWTVFKWSDPLPTQGWKIHVSATVTESVLFCQTILPFLLRQHCSFKIPASVTDIVSINAGEIGSTQTGKILTVYPKNDRDTA